jgi:predicted ferric reductase
MADDPRLDAMPGLTRAGAIAAGAIVVVFPAVAVIVAGLGDQTPVTLGIRLGALWGLLAMSIAALMSPFLVEIRRLLGAPFLRIHHVFAAFGLAAITVHPVLVAVRSASLSVFLPVFPFLERYAPNAGRVALPLIYIAVVAALLRTRFTEWRYLHLILYAALLLGLLHGVVFSDWFFGNLFLNVLYLGLGVAIVAAFALKRWQRRARPRPAPRSG